MARKPKIPKVDDYDPAEFLSTGEVMKQAGVSRQVLYQYTTLGLVREVAVTKAGYRLYPIEVLRQLEIIRSLNDLGYTLRDIRDIFAGRLQTGV